ncbi:MAG: hypothetical protein V4592_04845 [Bacteroidota bacterium]
MLKQLYRFNTAGGVAIHTQMDGSLAIDSCILSVKQQQLNFDKKITGLKHINDLNKHLPGKLMVAVNLSGKGVLTKQIEKTEEITAVNFNKVLPNANAGDFYIQNVISGSYSFVSVIRKAEADKWFTQLMEIGLQPVMLSLGPFAVLNVMDELNVYSEQLVFNGHIIKRNEQGEWLNYSYDLSAKAGFKIKIQAEAIAEDILLPYAAAFQLILNEQIVPVNTPAKLYNDALAGKQADLKLKMNGMLVLGVVFILLLANFIFFSWLASSNNKLNTQVSKTLQNTTDVKINSDQIREKESILQGLGWDDHTNKSSLIDQVAAILPHDVLWTGVAINPVDVTGSQQAKSIVFSNHTIKINGLADKVLSVNEWIARIKIKTWVQRVQLENYTFNNEINTGTFTLTITY